MYPKQDPARIKNEINEKMTKPAIMDWTETLLLVGLVLASIFVISALMVGSLKSPRIASLLLLSPRTAPDG